MKNGTSAKIKDYIKENVQASPEELTNYLGITKRAVFKQLKKLTEEGELKKIGKPPSVYYLMDSTAEYSYKGILPESQEDFIEDNFYLITAIGDIKEGLDGFAYWCRKRDFDFEKMAPKYISTLKKYSKFKVGGLVDGTRKLKNTFPDVFIDKVSYVDFYSIEIFGKTKLGQQLLYAKQSQDKDLIKKLSEEVKPVVEKMIKDKNIDAVCFVPPTVKREIQFMKELRKNLDLSVSDVEIVKIKTPVLVPQKTLSKLEERIENARKTYVIEDERNFKNVLIIDDAVGSGATMNEIAKKIKDKKVSTEKVYGLAITGSLKGFDVISEV